MVTSSAASAVKSAATSKAAPNWGNVAKNAINGHGALHNEGELTVLLALLDTLRPAVAVELGTYAGGGTWALAQLPSIRQIVTVDLDPRPQLAANLAGLRPQVNVVKGNSTHIATRADVLEALGGLKADVILVDGGHDLATARTDFEWAGQLGRPGGLIVMHDTQGYPGDVIMDVPQLWAQIKATYRVTELVDLPGGPGGTGLVWL